jgi:hypothetical protein
MSYFHYWLCDVKSRSCRGVLDTTLCVLDTTLCDKVCQWLEAGRWFSLGTPVSSTNKTDSHDITKILLKVAVDTINPKSILFKWKTKVIALLLHYLCSLFTIIELTLVMNMHKTIYNWTLNNRKRINKSIICR